MLKRSLPGLTALALVCLPLAAHAQADGGAVLDAAVVVASVPVVVAPPAAAAPVPLDDPAQLAARAVSAADQGDWRVLAVALLALAGFLLRNKTPTEGKLGVFLHSKKGALLLSAVSAAIGSAIPSLQGGASVRAVVISAVASAAGALCGWLAPAAVVKAAGSAAALALLGLGIGGCGGHTVHELVAGAVFGVFVGGIVYALRTTRSKPSPILFLLAGLLAPGLAFADCPPASFAVFRELPLSPYLVAGLWTGTFVTARCWEHVNRLVTRTCAAVPPWRIPAVVALGGLLASGCATPYPALDAAAGSGRAAIATFRQYDKDHKREILAAHAAECQAAPDPVVCFTEALKPYVTARDLVLHRIDILAPTLMEAEATAKQADADRKLTDALAAKVSDLTAALLRAVANLRGAP